MRLGERVVVGVLAGMLASGPLVGRMPAIAEPTPQAPEVKAAYEKVAKAGADDFMKAYKTQKAFPKGGAYFSQETIAKAQVRIEKTKALLLPTSPRAVLMLSADQTNMKAQQQ